MSINYTYTVIGITEKLGGNGEILNVHVDLVGTDSNEEKASRQFATSLNQLAHTDASFITDPTDALIPPPFVPVLSNITKSPTL